MAAGIEDLFEARDRRQHRRRSSTCKGKPAPDTFLAGAKALACQPAHAAVFEDALAGVQAGHDGHFGFVVGVDRVGHGHADALNAARRRRRGQGPRRAARRVVIEHPAFPVEPWAVRETELHLDNLAQTESVFALSNGHIGLRGNLDEGEPYGIPGTYLGGFYETRPLPYAEAGFGYPEDGQTVVNVTNGKLIRLLVEDEPFDVRYGVVRKPRARARPPRRRAAPRRGVESRRPAAPSGSARPGWCRSRTARWRRSSTWSRRSTAEFPVVVQSAAGGQRGRTGGQSGPARRGRAGRAAGVRHATTPATCGRSSSTTRARAGCAMAAAMDHLVEGPDGTSTDSEAFPDHARVIVTADLAPGKPLRIVKLLTYGWSARALGVRHCATRCRPPAMAPSTPAGTACARPSARTWTSSGSAPTSRSRATPSCSRRSASACSTRSRPGPAASSGRSPPRA